MTGKSFPGRWKISPFTNYFSASDPLVKLEWGRMTADKLQEMGRKVEFNSYRGVQHGACPEELEDLENFIDGILAGKEEGPAAAGL